MQFSVGRHIKTGNFRVDIGYIYIYGIYRIYRGVFWILLKIGVTFRVKGSQVPRLRTRSRLPELICQIYRILSDLADPPEMGGGTARRTLPSTRAGGQDDGSYTNSLKLTRWVSAAA